LVSSWLNASTILKHNSILIKENIRSVELESMMKQQNRLQELIRLDRELTAAEATEFAGLIIREETADSE
jgi:hypothetical protein